MTARGSRVTVDGRELTVTNLDKVLFPEAEFRKADLIDYYVTIAPFMLPHIQDRPLTMKRYPDGVSKKFFYEKHAPAHAPDWVRKVAVPTSDGEGEVEYSVVCDLPTLVWAANLGTIEFHVPLWKVGRHRKLPSPPDQMVFDLDPGEGASIVECCVVADRIAELLREKKLDPRPKTSGSKGLQVYAELQGKVTWDRLRTEAHDMATALERELPDLAVSNMRKELRRGKVLIDWSQNHPSKTTVGAYSVRGRAQPTVSTPVTWKEVRRCAAAEDASLMVFTTVDVIKRTKKLGDLFDPASTGR